MKIEQDRIKRINNMGEVVQLNVGGMIDGFRIHRKLLQSVPNSLLGEMFSGKTELKKVDDTLFIDRNPKIFALVLDYLRNNQCQM